MRTLHTDAEREEAAALVQDRQRWLTTRNLPVPARFDIPTLFRTTPTKPAGLFEDGTLLACMIPERTPDRSWGIDPCLFLSWLHTLPGQNIDLTRVITLWASNFAARLDLPCVRAEILTRPTAETRPVTLLLRRFTDMGWDIWGSGWGREGERTTRLQLTAEHRPGLSTLIGCTVQEPPASAGDRSGG